MNLDAIAIFVKVLESGSFSGAARALNMPKTTVSAKVAGLERQLGATLIQRTTRSLHVTEAGSAFFHRCAAALREIEQGEADLRATKGKPTGTLKVTAPVDIGQTLLPGIVQAYVRKFPDVAVELLITNRVVDLVREGIDIAIRAGPLQESSLIAKRFFASRSGLWASPRYLKLFSEVKHPRDLLGMSFILFSLMGSSFTMTNGKADVEVPLTGRIRADDIQTMKELAILGEGICWLPEFIARDAVSSKLLAPVLPRWSPKIAGIACHFLYAAQKYDQPNVKEFVQLATDWVNKSEPALPYPTRLIETSAVPGGSHTPWRKASSRPA